MELGSWALVNGPSLLGLLPLIVYIVLGMIMTKNMIVPLAIATFVGCVMSVSYTHLDVYKRQGKESCNE